MKKRMFITTIVMMLVLAVALTTSSLAWFSSANTAVTANSATFRAATASSSNVNLKISKTTGTWGNTIDLVSDTTRAMAGMIPVKPLIADDEDGSYTFPTTTGVEINGAPVTVAHANYKWDPRIVFNSAKINDEGLFIIEASDAAKDATGAASSSSNKVTDYKYNSQGVTSAASGFYYDEFYIHNADTQSNISSLTFEVQASLTTIYNYNVSQSVTGTDNGGEASDYACNAYAAFILFDAIQVVEGQTIPDNALDHPGKLVVAADANEVATTEINATTAVEGNNNDYIVEWIPFAAFTFHVDNGTKDVDEWQFADLDTIDDTPKFVYNNADIASLNTQKTEAISGNGGFTLNATTLGQLNSKVVSDAVATNGDVLVYTDSSYTRDNTAAENYAYGFKMPAGETFRVGMYYWLDGYSMTAFTDTTMASIGVTISAAH